MRIASRSTGGVAIRLSSRTPDSASCSVRGIGVAVSVSTCTSKRSAFSRSLCATPKCCSSSMTSSPRFLNRTDFASSACVPTTISTVPSASPVRVSSASFAPTKRESWRTRTGSPRNRSEKLLKCWRASSVVGAITATCIPDIAVTKVARSATSVLPKPTSPQISRSIGAPDSRSPSTSAMALSWSSVSA